MKSHYLFIQDGTKIALLIQDGTKIALHTQSVTRVTYSYVVEYRRISFPYKIREPGPHYVGIKILKIYKIYIILYR
jgi:hypothetical protein